VLSSLLPCRLSSPPRAISKVQGQRSWGLDRGGSARSGWRVRGDPTAACASARIPAPFPSFFNGKPETPASPGQGRVGAVAGLPPASGGGKRFNFLSPRPLESPTCVRRRSCGSRLFPAAWRAPIPSHQPGGSSPGPRAPPGPGLLRGGCRRSHGLQRGWWPRPRLARARS
jgi:hypothetical protein